MKYALLLLLCVVLSWSMQAQNVGIGTSSPDPTAKLHIASTNSGLLTPRLTTAQRDAITAPADGLIIYNTTEKIFQYWNSTCWLNAHQADCGDCTFGMSFSSLSGSIDRRFRDSVRTQINITQNTGNPQNIAFQVINTLPAEMTVTFQQNPAFSTSSTYMTVRVLPYIKAGSYPIIVKAFCGDYSRTIIYSVTVEPCYELPINNNYTNYVMGTEFYRVHPSAPRFSRVCVIAEVESGMEVTSNDASKPALSTSGLPYGSYVVLVNNGYILGKGGDGGTGYSPSSGSMGEGQDGGTAVSLSHDTYVQNNMGIFGGGGGGNAMAFEISWTPPAPGNIVTIGLFLGAGGGGGAGGSSTGIGGLGGNSPSSLIGISYYVPGLDGTAGPTGVGGMGGVLNYPITRSFGPLTVDFNPGAAGGQGGAYGYPGTKGVFDLKVDASIVINIPFFGATTIPVVSGVSIPVPIPPPPVGEAGYAIDHNNKKTNISDNHYTTSGVKGKVGNK